MSVDVFAMKSPIIIGLEGPKRDRALSKCPTPSEDDATVRFQCEVWVKRVRPGIGFVPRGRIGYRVSASGTEAWCSEFLDAVSAACSSRWSASYASGGRPGSIGTAAATAGAGRSQRKYTAVDTRLLAEVDEAFDHDTAVSTER